ncbi:MAG: GAF domain-containing protein [Candidatus Koribacter versatilis]|uniref:GAF domain-containing protein n=1 Tax=Candidatus Korobacter versatilis TaxID=658062 RepID=A0A932A774_9BACT|nr:GAF domain-containing protein [Candidatus Koribacter versatilis]
MSPTAQSSAEPRADRFQQFVVEVADVINTTLDLDTLLTRVAEVIRRFIDYEIFAILLLNDKTQELRMRFEIGHQPGVKERLRVKLGEGITGTAVQHREAVMSSDVSQVPNYINAHPDVRSELAVPMIVKNRVIGVLDIQSTHLGYFTEEHARMLSLVASRIASGIENARLYTRVSRQARTLEVLNEISRELTSILNIDELFKRTAEALNRLIDYQMFSILLLDAGGTILQHRFSLRFKQSIQLKHDIPLGRGLVGYAAQTGEPVLVPDVAKDPRYIAVNPETKSELCVPLKYKEKVIGVLDLEHTRRGYFTEDHMRTITTLAAQIAISLENARLYQRIAKEEQRLERDLAMAREIQLRLLPESCPTISNAQIAAKFVPARELGGDMYDFARYAGRRTATAIGDVSGKGAPAALYAALAGGLLRTHAALELSPAQMLAAMNSSLLDRPVEAQYLSLIYALWDERSNSMLVANSGLPRPIFCHGGKTEVVEVRGLPLGLFREATYDEVRVPAAVGDLFVFMSDGIIDAGSEAADTFGRRRVEQVIVAHQERSADDIVTAIFTAVNEFSRGTEPFDDQTVVVVKVTG